MLMFCASPQTAARESCCEWRERERFLEANKKCVTHSDLGSAASRLPAGAGVGTVAEMVVGTVGTVAEMVVEGVEYVIRLASRAGERERESRCRMSLSWSEEESSEAAARRNQTRSKDPIPAGQSPPRALDRVARHNTWNCDSPLSSHCEFVRALCPDLPTIYLQNQETLRVAPHRKPCHVSRVLLRDVRT